MNKSPKFRIQRINEYRKGIIKEKLNENDKEILKNIDWTTFDSTKQEILKLSSIYKKTIYIDEELSPEFERFNEKGFELADILIDLLNKLGQYDVQYHAEYNISEKTKKLNLDSIVSQRFKEISPISILLARLFTSNLINIIEELAENLSCMQGYLAETFDEYLCNCPHNGNYKECVIQTSLFASKMKELINLVVQKIQKIDNPLEFNRNMN